MRSRLRTVLICAPLVLGGCDRAEQLWSSVRGDDEAQAEADDAKSDAEQRLGLERELAELAELEAERRERERIEAENRRKALEQADALVVQWADRLAAAKQANGAFSRHEGLSDDDPWGKQLRIHYSDAEDQDSQTLEVRSAGPNGEFDDDDDLVRTRTTQIERGWWERNKLWVLVAIVWLGVGFVSAGGMRRRRVRKRGGDEALDAADILISLIYIVFAPLTMLFWLLVLLLEVIGEVAD
jgi:hypothetical protein